MNHTYINELIVSEMEIQFHKNNIKQILPVFGQELNQARKESGKTIRAICEELGVSIGFYCDLERGARKPNPEILEKIRKMFPDDLG